MTTWLALNPAVEERLTPTLRALIYRASSGTAATMFGLGNLIVGWLGDSGPVESAAASVAPLVKDEAKRSESPVKSEGAADLPTCGPKEGE